MRSTFRLTIGTPKVDASGLSRYPGCEMTRSRPMLPARLVALAAVATASLMLAACSDYGNLPKEMRPLPKETRELIAKKGMKDTAPDPGAHLQGRIEAGGLEAPGGDRPLRLSEDLRHLRMVGRARAEESRGRPAGAGGLLHDHPGADEPEVELLPVLQHRLSERLRPVARPHRLASDGAWRLLVAPAAIP